MDDDDCSIELARARRTLAIAAKLIGVPQGLEVEAS